MLMLMTMLMYIGNVMVSFLVSLCNAILTLDRRSRPHALTPQSSVVIFRFSTVRPQMNRSPSPNTWPNSLHCSHRHSLQQVVRRPLITPLDTIGHYHIRLRTKKYTRTHVEPVRHTHRPIRIRHLTIYAVTTKGEIDLAVWQPLTSDLEIHTQGCWLATRVAFCWLDVTWLGTRPSVSGESLSSHTRTIVRQSVAGNNLHFK